MDPELPSPVVLPPAAAHMSDGSNADPGADNVKKSINQALDGCLQLIDETIADASVSKDSSDNFAISSEGDLIILESEQHEFGQDKGGQEIVTGETADAKNDDHKSVSKLGSLNASF